MSRHHPIMITCPKCGKESEFLIWDSINTKLDPDMKDKVLSGEAFMFTCPECNNETFVDYTFLYHQMEDQIMIYYIQKNQSIEEASNFMLGKGPDGKQLDINFEIISEKYRNRIVRTYNELKEKIYIFDSGFDDRVIEIIKVVYSVMGYEKYPDIKIENVFFSPEDDGSSSILFLNGGKVFASAPVTNEIYADILDKFKDRIEKASKDNLVFDFNWAMGLYE